MNNDNTTIINTGNTEEAGRFGQGSKRGIRRTKSGRKIYLLFNDNFFCVNNNWVNRIFTYLLVYILRFSKQYFLSNTQFINIVTQELDRYSNSDNDNNILQTNLSFFVELRGNRWRIIKKQIKETEIESWRRNSEPAREEITDMRPFTLKKHNWDYIEFEAYERSPKVHYIVESEEPVKVYIVDDDGLEDFKGNKKFHAYNDKVIGRYNEEKIFLPYKGIYYIIIYNPNENDVAIHCEIY